MVLKLNDRDMMVSRFLLFVRESFLKSYSNLLENVSFRQVTEVSN